MAAELDEANPRAQTRRFHAKQEAILVAAAEVFNASGIRGGTLSEVAARVGLATSSVTYYYPKRDALAAVCLVRSLGVHRRLIAEAAREPTVPGRVKALFDGVLRLLADIETGAHPILMFMTDTKALTQPHAGPVFEQYVAMARDMHRLLKGPETAHLDKTALSARSFFLLSMMQWARLCVVPQEPARYAYVAERITDLLLNGFATERAAWPCAEDIDAFRRDVVQRPEITDPFLRSASLLVNENGYRGASLDRISAELSVTKGALYRRRDTKDDLIGACFDRTHLLHELVWGAAESHEGTGWSALCMSLRSLLWFQLSEFGPTLRATATTALPDEVQQAVVREAARRMTLRVSNQLVRGMVDGSVRPCDPAIAAQVLRCVVDVASGLPNWTPAANGNNITELLMKPALFGLLAR